MEMSLAQGLGIKRKKTQNTYKIKSYMLSLQSEENSPKESYPVQTVICYNTKFPLQISYWSNPIEVIKYWQEGQEGLQNYHSNI